MAKIPPRILPKRELLRLFARGEREMAKGKGYSLGSVMADADALLAEKEA
jgi:hypothetical protein